MDRPVMVPLDGSPLAERALPFGAGLAQQSGSSLLLVRAVSTHTIPTAEGEQERREALDDAAQYLTTVAQRLAQGAARDGRVPVTSLSVYGDAAPALLEAARTHAASMIVMATHSRFGVERWLYGSVADEVLRHAESPVLLLPAACEAPALGWRVRSIVVPLDGSNFAREALTPAVELARAHDAHVWLVQVVEPPTVYPATLVAEALNPTLALASATSYLQGEAATLRRLGLRVQVHADIGPAGPTIAEIARAKRADVIVMATHGRSGLARMVLGSVAVATLQHTHVPLLLVRPAGLNREPLPGDERKAVATLSAAS